MIYFSDNKFQKWNFMFYLIYLNSIFDANSGDTSEAETYYIISYESAKVSVLFCFM